MEKKRSEKQEEEVPEDQKTDFPEGRSDQQLQLLRGGQIDGDDSGGHESW